MQVSYDLHSHSTASDGTLSPSELVQRAHRQGVQVLALTDHDTLEGLPEARQAANDCAITLIPGVEISVTWHAHTIHIVGLNIDPGCVPLQSGLADLRDFRQRRAQEIGRRLEKAGISNAYEGARALSTGRLISRTHFARYIVDQGYAKSVRDVFKHYLVNNRPGFVSGQWTSLEQAVDWIRTAGGHAVIAHPARYKLTASKLRELIQQFIQAGGEGIEVISGSHTLNEHHTMCNYARQFNLHASCGSDYHGPENPWIELGQLGKLPKNCKPVWELWSVSGIDTAGT